MISGKVIDKATGAPMKGVHVVLTDVAGQYIKDDKGTVLTETNDKGTYEIEMGPGQILQFNMPGYPVMQRSYEDAIRKPDMVMDDASGSALSLPEVRAFMNDARSQLSGRWMIGVAVGLLLLVAFAILAKRNGWI